MKGATLWLILDLPCSIIKYEETFLEIQYYTAGVRRSKKQNTNVSFAGTQIEPYIIMDIVQISKAKM